MINVDDRWWGDARRDKLITMCGSSITADGVAMAMWRLAAQSKKSCKPITKKQFQTVKHWEAFLECELAEERDGAFYIKGSKRGASKKKPLAKQVTTKEVTVLENVVAKYCELWKKRYNSRGVITGKDAGQLQRLKKELGMERAVELMTAYFSMPDSWIVKKRHPVSILVSSLNEISHFNDTGKVITMTSTKKADEDIHYRQQSMDAHDNLSDKEKAEIQACFEPDKILLNGASND